MILTSFFCGIEVIIAKKIFSSLLILDLNTSDKKPFQSCSFFEEVIEYNDKMIVGDQKALLILMGLFEMH